MNSSDTVISPNVVELDGRIGLDTDKEADREKVEYASAAIPVLNDAEEQYFDHSLSDELYQPSIMWPVAKRLLKWGVELRGQA